MTSIIKGRFLVFSFCIILSGNLHAITRTWDGGAKDGSFKNSVNWDTDLSAPSNNDALQVGVNTIGGDPHIGFDTGGEFRTPSFTFLSTAITQYTVTTGTGSDFLTLTGTTVALLNSSPIRQKFEIITTTVGAATQTWNGGSQGLIMAEIDLGSNHVLTFDGTGVSSTTRNEISGGITGTVNSGVTKMGTGTLLFNTSVASDYPGPTTITNGRLLLGRANQIPNGSKLVLNGGTFDTGGFSDTVGALMLGGTATIDFGASGTVSLIFGDSHSELWSAGTLNIVNFAGADSLRVGVDKNALTSAQLAQISINGMAATITNSGFLLPVPEPGVSMTILSGLIVFGFSRCRRHRGATA